MVDSPTFSYSRLSCFESCPRNYEYRYIQRIPEPFVTVEQLLGRAVHGSIEWLYTQPRGEPTEEAVIRRFDELWRQANPRNALIVKKGRTHQQYFDEGLGLIRDFFTGLYAGDDTATEHLEHSFTIDLDSGIRFTGVIDRICRTASGMIRLTDYKTGKMVGGPTESLQLPSYALYALEEYSLEEIELCIVSLREARTEIARFPREQMTHVATQLVERIGAVLAATEYPSNPSALCRWCAYRDICPDGPGKRTQYVGTPPAGGVANCPRCGKPLQERSGRFGSFVGCTGFPDCRFTRDRW